MSMRSSASRSCATAIISYLSIAAILFAPAVSRGSLTLNFRFADDNSTTKNVSLDAAGTSYTVNVWATISSSSSLKDGFQAMYWGAQTVTDNVSANWTGNIDVGTGSFPNTAYATISGGATTTPFSAVQATLTNGSATFDLNKSGQSQMASAPVSRNLQPFGFYASDGKKDLAGSTTSDFSGFMRSTMGTNNAIYSDAVPAQTVLKTNVVGNTFEVLIGTFNVVNDLKGTLPGSLTTAFSVRPVVPSGLPAAALATWVEDWNGSGSPNILTPEEAAFSVGTGVNFAVQSTGGGPNQWALSGGGNYDATASWSSSAIPDGATATANFWDNLTSSGTVSLASAHTLNAINFKKTGGGTVQYTIGAAGSPAITLGGASPNVTFDATNTQDHAIASNLVLGAASGSVTLAPNSGRKLTLSGQLDWGAGTQTVNVTSGTVRIASSAAATNVTSGDSLSISSGATLELGGSVSSASTGSNRVNVNNNGTVSVTGTNQIVGDLVGNSVTAPGGGAAFTGTTTVASGGSLEANKVRQQSLSLGTSSTAKLALNGSASGFAVLSGLSISGTSGVNQGSFDLMDNDLVLYYTGASPYATVNQWVIDGIINNTGIVSTDPRPLTFARTFAVFDNADLLQTDWYGYTVSSGVDFKQVIAKYTYFGDANLDGMVTPDDYAGVDANIGLTNAKWWQGDLNFDGLVTTDDYAVIDAAIGAGTGGTNNQSLPEPSTVVLGAMGFLLLIGRQMLTSRERRAC